MTEPSFPVLKTKFERVPNWDTVCPFLLVDNDGTITEGIDRNNTTVPQKRAEMLRKFLQMSDPTWKKVLDALRAGSYNNLADEIERDVIAGRI